MQYLKFLFYEMILFSPFFILNFYESIYPNSPFTQGGFLNLTLTLLIYAVLIGLLIKLFLRFNTISFKRKILLSIPNLFLSGLIIGIIMFFVFGAE
ncbi:hypothetical protein SAMN05880501_11762 [Ureibacillus xyleni]|uniref:Uncharacterized protein n=1 Tax=Ureibacillus xyleni TaxID=614648 RepID=A0A285TNZ5_9BACL|nr:hypothetical protein SAMN05880501_11762 [Ureibacillus xyleni]